MDEGKAVQQIYEADIIMSSQRVALRSLARYERDHLVEFSDLDWGDLLEVRRNLLRRAFEPKACVKITQRLLARGNDIVRGAGPDRITTKRHKARFLGALHVTIASAAARFMRAINAN